MRSCGVLPPPALRRLTVDADLSLPVLGGFDVVAYWTLPDGAEPVLGTSALMALYGNYRFFFSSIENLRAFEVKGLRSIDCNEVCISVCASGAHRTSWFYPPLPEVSTMC